MEFSRQECWSGLSLTSPGDLPHPGIEPAPPASSALQAESFLLSHWGSPLKSNPIQFKFPQSAAGLKRSSPQESPHARSRKCALWSFQKLENWCHMGGYEIAQAKAWLTLKAGIWNKTEFTFWEKKLFGALWVIDHWRAAEKTMWLLWLSPQTMALLTRLWETSSKWSWIFSLP